MEGSLNHHLTLNWGKKLWNFTINKSRKKRTPCHFWIETTISNQYHHQNCKSYLLDEEWWTTLKIKEKILRDPNIYFFDGWIDLHEDKNRVSFSREDFLEGIAKEDLGGNEPKDIFITENSEETKLENTVENGDISNRQETKEVKRNTKSAKKKGRTATKIFNCPLCLKDFNSPQSLHIHKKVKHELVRYNCTQCDRQFQKKLSLKIHIETKHEGIKYPCKYCGKLYANLRNHVQFLHGNVNYECTETRCNFQSKNRRIFKFHVQSKHELVRYNCTQCDYQANHRNSLNIHIQSKHEGIKYECQECGHQSSTVFNAKRHVDSVHMGLRYPCNLCNKQYIDMGSLRDHIKSKH